MLFICSPNIPHDSLIFKIDCIVMFGNYTELSRVCVLQIFIIKSYIQLTII